MCETKKCNVCNLELPISNFYFRKESGKYRNNCKKCKPLLSKDKIIELAKSSYKICKHCGIEKSRSDFNLAANGKYSQPYCKYCDSERKRNYTIKNAEKVKEKRKLYYLKNRESIILKNKNKPKPPKKERVYNRISDEEKKKRKKENSKKYREKNSDKLREIKREYNKRIGNQRKKESQKRMMQNIDFRIKKNLRGRVYVALKRGIKSESTMNLLGCTIDEFKIHFESLFIDGMTWDKYMEGGIHIDHKIPCIAFDLTDIGQQKKCFHYSNLQPLWAIDNLKKGVKYE
jgi:FKBP-type peptidyl-prolyl cis-trans isomerase